jgi:hypothetical protein
MVGLSQIRIDNQMMVKADARGGNHPAIVATVPVTANPSTIVFASSCILSPSALRQLLQRQVLRQESALLLPAVAAAFVLESS